MLSALICMYFLPTCMMYLPGYMYSYALFTHLGMTQYTPTRLGSWKLFRTHAREQGADVTPKDPWSTSIWIT